MVRVLGVEELRAEVGERVGFLPTNPFARVDLADVVRAGVVRVHDQKAEVARLVVEVDAEQREGQLAAADRAGGPGELGGEWVFGAPWLPERG